MAPLGFLPPIFLPWSQACACLSLSGIAIYKNSVSLKGPQPSQKQPGSNALGLARTCFSSRRICPTWRLLDRSSARRYRRDWAPMLIHDFCPRASSRGPMVTWIPSQLPVRGSRAVTVPSGQAFFPPPGLQSWCFPKCLLTIIILLNSHQSSAT